MARPRRVECSGAIYHLTTRGNARQAIALDDADRYDFCHVLGQVVRRFRWLCHAYCLMDNHYHLLVETLEPTLSNGMRHLNGVYTQRFNRRHQRVGHVFQGRFKAILVERDPYLLELCRYVVLNPVRARMVRTAGEWPWSSYPAMVGVAAVPAWLHTDWVLSQFGTTRREAQVAYAAFVQEGLQVPSPWAQLRGQIYLGSTTFCAPFRQEDRLTPEVPRAHQQPVRPALAELFAAPMERRARCDLAQRAHHVYGYRLKEIATHLGVHVATISRWVNAAKVVGRNRGMLKMFDCKT